MKRKITCVALEYHPTCNLGKLSGLGTARAIRLKVRLSGPPTLSGRASRARCHYLVEPGFCAPVTAPSWLIIPITWLKTGIGRGHQCRFGFSMMNSGCLASNLMEACETRITVVSQRLAPKGRCGACPGLMCLRFSHVYLLTLSIPVPLIKESIQGKAHAVDHR